MITFAGLQTQILSSNRLKLLLLATPVLIGSGFCLYYYYYFNDQKSSSNDKKKKDLIKDPIKAKLIESIEIKNKGNDLFKEKKYKDAIEMYTKAIQLCPPDRRTEMATFYQNRAACHEHMKQYDQVIQDSTKAIENNRQYIKAYLRRGKAYETIDNYDDACYDYYVAVNLSQYQNSDYMNLFSDCMEKYCRKKATKIVSKRNDCTFPKYLFKQLFLKFSRDPLKRREKELLSNDIDYDLFIKQLFTRDDNDLNQDDTLLKGTIELCIGKHEDGEKKLKKLIDTNENIEYKVSALLKLAEHTLQNMNFEKSENFLTDATALDNENPDLYYTISQLHLSQSKIEDAINDLKRAIELDPLFSAAIGQRLYLKYQRSIMTNNYIGKDQILKEFEIEVEKFPTSNLLLLLYYQILLSEHKEDEALIIIEKAINNSPDDPTLYVYRSFIDDKENPLEKTKEYLDKALELNSKCSFAYEMLSNFYMKLNDSNKAIDYLERAINCSTTFEDVKNLIASQKAIKMQIQYQSTQSY